MSMLNRSILRAELVSLRYFLHRRLAHGISTQVVWARYRGRCLGASPVITLEVAEDSIGRGVELLNEGVEREEERA